MSDAGRACSPEPTDDEVIAHILHGQRDPRVERLVNSLIGTREGEATGWVRSLLDRLLGRDTRPRCVAVEAGPCPFIGVVPVEFGDTHGAPASVLLCHWHAWMLRRTTIATGSSPPPTP